MIATTVNFTSNNTIKKQKLEKSWSDSRFRFYAIKIVRLKISFACEQEDGSQIPYAEAWSRTQS